MKKLKIKVPPGINYLSEVWDELKQKVPNGHYILDKKICGCGATEAILRDLNQKTILACPRKQLLYNKYTQHLNDCHLYSFIDKEQYFNPPKYSQEAIMMHNDRLMSFVQNGGSKILVTYDSLDKVSGVLKNSGIKLEDCLVVVDEMQAIFYDAFMKPDVELEFTNGLKMFNDVVYLSATPYLEEYLDGLSDFKDLPFVELDWPDEYIEKPNIELVKCSSIYDECSRIIDAYRSGNGRTTLLNGETFTSSEAVIFVNSVQVIENIIKKNNLSTDEVDVICAGKNNMKLAKLGHSITTIPGKDEPRKMFTLCTSTVYLGADFYSDNAYTYIFATPKITSMALDTSTDLHQIIGRQRLEENPFRNSATLFYTTKECDISKDEFTERMKEKERRSLEKIQNFESAPHPDTMLNDLENTIKVEKYSNDFCSIKVDNKTGKQKVVINELVIASQSRSWQILHDIYNNDFSFYLAVKKKNNVTLATSSDNPEVQKLFKEWKETKNFTKRMKLFCSIPIEIIEQVNFIEKKYYTYFDALGEEGLQALSWREDYIKAALDDTPFNPQPRETLAKRIVEAFHIGEVKSRKDVKRLLQEIYDDLGIDKKATAEDLSSYITIQPKRDSKLFIASHSRRFVSLFPQLNNPNRSELWDVDKVLDMIQTDSYYNLSSKVGAVRSACDKEEADNKKALLPLVCWNGIFKYRESSLGNLTTYSSFTALDFDKFSSTQEMEVFKEQLKGYDWVYAIFTTPSGKGLKAIILHDNIHPEFHINLYQELMGNFDIPELDPHTKDLARGNYLSYDPDLWKNPAPKPYHFDSSNAKLTNFQPLTYTVKQGNDGSPVIYEDDIEESSLLHKFCTCIVSDRSVLNMLRKRWESDDRSKNRNNKALSYLGILCKAGIPKTKAVGVVSSLFDNWSSGEIEISHAAEWAYKHNLFGCDRMKFKPHK